MKKIFIMCCLSLFFWKGNAQLAETSLCYTNLNKADSLYFIENYVDAMPYYIAAMNGSCLKQSAYQIAKIWTIHKNDIDSAFVYLDLATKHDSSMYRLLFGEFFPLLKDSRWKHIIQSQLKKYESKFGKFNNINYVENLCELSIINVAPRTVRRFATDSIVWAEEKNNIKKLEKLINEYGYPTNSEVGWEFCPIAFLVIHHTLDLNIMEKYLPYIKRNVKNCEENPIDLAYLMDRIAILKGKKQKYGTQMSYDSEKNMIFDIKSVKHSKTLNKRRSKIGLNSIEEYVKSSNIMINVFK